MQTPNGSHWDGYAVLLLPDEGGRDQLSTSSAINR